MTRVRESCRDGRAGRNFLRSASDTPATTLAFSLIELLVVIAIIIALAGLILGTVGYVQKKSARSRAETEIAAMSAAIESYKADNGIYPRDNTTTQYTDTLDARQNTDATQLVYQSASSYLFTQLSALDLNQTPIAGAKSYITFKPNMLGTTTTTTTDPITGITTTTTTVNFIRDPFGNSYGYSTANQADPATPKGYNPTFDLWSTAGVAPSPTPAPPVTQQDLWIKNW